MAQETATTDGGHEQTIEATISADSVVKALKLNNTDGVDDRVIAVPRSGGEAKVRKAFRGSERYSNPESAPIRVRPESLVEDAWRSVPTRGQVDNTAIDVPELRADWDDDDEQAFGEAYENIVEVWETDVRGMVLGDHELDTDPKIHLEGIDNE